VAAGAEQDIRVADGSRMYANANLIRAGLWLRQIQDLQFFGTAKVEKADSFHGPRQRIYGPGYSKHNARRRCSDRQRGGYGILAASRPATPR
jgi:hypothetical protein